MSAESNCAFLLLRRKEGANERREERERAGLNRAEKYHTHCTDERGIYALLPTIGVKTS